MSWKNIIQCQWCIGIIMRYWPSLLYEIRMIWDTILYMLKCGVVVLLSSTSFSQFITSWSISIFRFMIFFTLESVASDSFMHVSRSQISDCRPSHVFSGNPVFISQTYQGKKLLVLLYTTGYMQLHSIGWYLCVGPWHKESCHYL